MLRSYALARTIGLLSVIREQYYLEQKPISFISHLSVDAHRWNTDFYQCVTIAIQSKQA